MSGIFGVYHLDEQLVRSEVLQQMSNMLEHRGSDGVDVWYEDKVGLGHRLLWTTPESLLEKQPLTDQDENFVITADARIDNREELIPRLDLKDFPPEKITDAQVILEAYHKWGEKCPQELLGDFAFAIWDKQKQQLFCARDHFGVKPFYYYSAESVFTFASEIKAILSLPEVPQKLNKVRIGDYLASIFEDRAITFYQDILRLPPAHSLTVSSKQIEIKSYWSLDPSKELILDSDEEYADQFRKIFTEAVSCRLRSYTQPGTMLSGGLDSSSITCTARKIMDDQGITAKLPTFSAVYDEVKESDERIYINTVLNRGGYEPNYSHVDQISPLTDNLERVMWHQDEPLFAFNLFLSMSLCDIAQKQGIRVILDGFDGDSTVSHGVGYLRDLARQGKWRILFKETKGYARNFDLSFWKMQRAYVFNYGIDPLVDKFKPLKLVRRLWRGLVRRIKNKTSQPEAAWKTGINSNFVEQIKLAKRHKISKKPLIESRVSQRADHHYSLVRGVMPYTLEVLDKAAASYSVELRFPFWDRRLVEFCLSLPPEQKIRQGWTRMIMRQGLKGVLPPEIELRRGKSNLAPGFRHGFFTFERQRVELMLSQKLAKIADYVDRASFQKAAKRFLQRESDGNEEIQVWKALNLSLWLQNWEQANSCSKSKPDI